MSVIGMCLMWVLFAVVFAVMAQWPMGKEIQRRQEYWEKYEV